MSSSPSLLTERTYYISLAILLLGFLLMALLAAYRYGCADISAMNHALPPDIELGLPANPSPVRERKRNNVEIVYKRRESGGDDDAEDCCICLEEFNNGESCMVLSCDHTFHRDCIKRWLRINKHCPVCRDRVRGRFIKGEDDS